MSRKASSSSDGNVRRLCSHQTPLRRSPRFLSQKKVECINTDKPYYIKKPKNPSAAKSHLRSALFSPYPEETPSSNETKQRYTMKCLKESSRPIRTQEVPRRSTAPVDASRTPRRSQRLVSNSADASKEEASLPYPEEIASGKKTRRGYSAERRKKSSRSTGTQKVLLEESQRKCLRSTGMDDAPPCRRRSLRLASNPSEVTIKESGLDGTMNCGKVRERRRPPEEIPASNEAKQWYSMKGQKESSSLIRTQDVPQRSTAQVDASRSRRRSLRDASKEDASLPHLEEITSGKKTRRGYSVKSRNKSSRSTGTQRVLLEKSQRKCLGSTSMDDAPPYRRRSLRLASNPSEVMIKGSVLDVTMNCDKVREWRQAATLMVSVKIPGKTEAGINWVDVERGNKKRGITKNGTCPSSRMRIGGDNKRRKIEKDGDEKVAIIKTEKEEHDGFLGCIKEEKTGCRKKAGIRRTAIEECCSFEGWTTDQEKALQRAYFKARPTPRFWKKVSKMVPGKTAKECFDRVHEEFATPPQPQPQPRLRKDKTNLSPIANFNLSANKSAAEFAEPKTKRSRISKKKNLVALKTARHLLRKHRLVDQSTEADHFSVLETSLNALALEFPDFRTPATPGFISHPPSFLQKCNERSSSSCNKSLLSRSKPPTRLEHVSPEVLKQVKNVVLHEKYIDILHCREARRRAFAKTFRSVDATEHSSSSMLKTGVTAARTALISEARDVISHFRNLQANTIGNHDGFDTDDDDADTFDDASDDE